MVKDNKKRKSKKDGRKNRKEKKLVEKKQEDIKKAIEKKPKRRAFRGQRATISMLNMQFGNSKKNRNQKTESFLRFKRRANNTSKNIRSKQRIGMKAAMMIRRDKKDYISNLIARAITFTNNRLKRQLQARDIYAALEDIHFLETIAPRTVRLK